MMKTNEQVRHEFATSDPIDLSVEFGQGYLHISAEEVRQTSIAISGRFAEKVDVVHNAGKVVVRSPRVRDTFGRGAALDIHITIPTGSALACKTGSADIDVTGQVADARLGSGSGDISLEAAAGSAQLETGSGAIRIGRASGDTQIKSGSGDVTLEDSAGDAVTVSTGSGDLRIGECHAALHAKSGSGDTVIDRCRADADIFSSSGDIEIRSVREGRITLRTASGDSRVGIPARTPVWTDIVTRSGRVSSDLPSMGEPQDGQPYVALHINSSSGNVWLTEVPA